MLRTYQLSDSRPSSYAFFCKKMNSWSYNRTKISILHSKAIYNFKSKCITDTSFLHFLLQTALTCSFLTSTYHQHNLFLKKISFLIHSHEIGRKVIYDVELCFCWWNLQDLNSKPNTKQKNPTLFGDVHTPKDRFRTGLPFTIYESVLIHAHKYLGKLSSP